MESTDRGRGTEALTDATEAASAAHPARRRILATLAVLPALVHPAATLLARRDWRLDLLTTFQLPALVATCLSAAALLAIRRRRVAAALLVLAAFQIWPIARYRLPDPVAPDPTRPERLKILVANVLLINDDYERLAELIRVERPDIVGLIEISPEWVEGLERTGIRREYPARLEWPTGVRGQALWFRAGGPVPSFRVLDRPYLVPPMTADFEWAGRNRTLWLAHPPNFLAMGTSVSEFEKLARAVAGDGGSRIVVGDLNRTSGSPHFDDFLATTGLRDSRRGFGEQPSWPTWSPYRIAIDHALVADDLAVVARRLGPDVGSDHLPLIVELAPADEATNSDTQSAHSGP